jgi:uncharacterized delta-60 repeat protein
MRRFAILAAGLLVPAMLVAQLGEGWISTYTGPHGAGFDWGKRIACDADGYVYACGSGMGVDNVGNFITIKYNPADGAIVWVRYYKGANEGYPFSEANAIAVDNAGGVYVTGYMTNANGDDDFATVKYTTDGDSCWDATYDGGFGQDVACAIAVDNSGGVYVTGYASCLGNTSDFVTIKYNATNGSQAWTGPATYDGPDGNNDAACAIAVDNLGGVYVTGYSTHSDFTSDYVTLKYSAANGSQAWTSPAIYDGPDHNDDAACAIAVDNAGGVYVTGYSTHPDYTSDYATVKYNAASGSEAWTSPAIYDGPDHNNDRACAIAVDNAGGVYVTGYSTHLDYTSDYVTLKYSAANGSQVWTSPAVYDGPDHKDDMASAIAVDNSGVYVTGKSQNSEWYNDYASVRYAADDGELLGTARYDGGVGDDEASSIAAGLSGCVYVTGKCAASSGTNIVTIQYTTGTGQQPPAAFNLSSPVDDVTGVLTEGDLTWEASTGADYYEVSLGGTVYQAATNTYHYSGLGYSTEYAWNVTACNDGGNTASTNGPFSFTTIIEKPAAFDLASPGDGAENQALSGTLAWGGAERATSYDVYLGPDPDDPTMVSEGQAGTSYDYSGLSYSTSCYWKVVAKNVGGSTESETWSFATASSPGTADVGIAGVVHPNGVVDTLNEDPEATVHNYGTLTRSFDAWLEIRDSATNTLRYQQSLTVTNLEGGGDYDAVFPAWDVPNDREGRYYVTCYTTLVGDINMYNDTARGQFAVQAAPQQTPNWTQWNNVPAGGSPAREVGAGAASATDPQGLYAYLLKGNSTCEFYRYDPATETWSTLDAIPERGRNNTPRTVKAGGTLAQVNGKFYATKGGNSLEFWEYDPAATPGYRWTQKADVPAGAVGVHSGASAAGVTAGSDSYVYLLKASGTFEFYRYSVADNAWTTMAAAPGQLGEEFAGGSSVSYDGTDTIFALKGGLNGFYDYVVSTNTWQTRASLPLGNKLKQAKAGAAVCYHLNRVYCIKGGNTQEFWVYNCTDNSWMQGSDVPLGLNKNRVQDGGSLVYCRDSRYLFCTKGGSFEFWSFGRLLNYGQQTPDGVVSLQTPGVSTYGMVTASALVPGRDRVAFALPKAGNVSLKLYDMTGRVARVLVNGWHEAGRHEVGLGAASLAQGAYILRYATGDFLESRKLVVQR